MIDASQDGGLAAATRPKQDKGLLRPDHEVDALEHIELTERLPHLLGADHGLVSHSGLSLQRLAVCPTGIGLPKATSEALLEVVLADGEHVVSARYQRLATMSSGMTWKFCS